MLTLEPWLSRLSIVAKSEHRGSRVQPLTLRPQQPDLPWPRSRDFAWAQRTLVAEVERQYNAGLPVRVIVLKARQLGTSTISSAIQFVWAFIHANTQGLIVAHENRTAQSLFEMTQFFWDSCPWHDLFHAKHATQRRLVWQENGSGIDIASAANLGAGRGRTLSALHVSEAAFYPEPEELMIGLRNTMSKGHGTIEVVESTANGVGDWFHNEWLMACRGESSYVPLFFPWYKHYEYTSEHEYGETTLDSLDECDDEERRLYGLGASFTSLEWRRRKLFDTFAGDELLFRQEYPATPEEAFIVSGSAIFNQQKVLDSYVPSPVPGGRLISPDGVHDIRWVRDDHARPDLKGALYVFKAPLKDGRSDRYFLAADPSRTTTGDPACIQVINRATLEQVAVWHGRVPPRELAHEIIKLGTWYNTCEVCPEVEGGGQGTIATLIERGYPRIYVHRWADRHGVARNTLGFSSSYNRKHWAITELQYLLDGDQVTIHDPETIAQLQTYVRLSEAGDMGPSSRSGHDDAVMALAICLLASRQEPAFVEWHAPTAPPPHL